MKKINIFFIFAMVGMLITSILGCGETGSQAKRKVYFRSRPNKILRKKKEVIRATNWGFFIEKQRPKNHLKENDSSNSNI